MFLSKLRPFELYMTAKFCDLARTSRRAQKRSIGAPRRYQDNYPPDNYPPDNYPPDNYPRTNTPRTITPLGQIPPGHLPPLKVLPCVYALLPNKQQATYNRLFEILKEHQNNLAPQNVMVDFELAVLNAITTSFPDSSKKGCFFHFSQAIFKKIQSLGLQVRYKDDEDFAHKVRMLAALAFVPEADVIDAFEAVSEDFPLDAQAVIDYFEDTYIGRLRPGGHRRAPLFDMELWNIYNQTIDDLPRTNNAVEGWHRSFQANVGAYHPNFWRFIDILKREQNLTQVNIAQARAGHPAEPQRRRYQDSNQRIKNIVQDYPNRNIMQYLRGLAHNISM